MIECPEHGKPYLYKQILNNGMVAIGCTAHKCEWKSQELPRHDFKDTKNIGQTKNEWRG